MSLQIFKCVHQVLRNSSATSALSLKGLEMVVEMWVESKNRIIHSLQCVSNVISTLPANFLYVKWLKVQVNIYCRVVSE